MRKALRRLTLVLGLLMVAQWLAAQAPVAAKQLGSIRKMSGTELTLAPDQGPEMAVHIQPGARLLQMAPGQKDLKQAAVIQASDLQPGDRVLVRGAVAADGSLNAIAVIVMKQQDIAQQKQQELQDWQRRSVGGVVKSVDPATGAIVLLASNKTVTVRTTPKTSYKRYSPDSVRWEDASTAKLEDVHPGDQLRAKGDKNEDGTELTAEAAVAGTFRNISGLVTAVDAAQGTLTVQDLATKHPVTVRVTAEAQMRKLPPQLAQGLAARMKGGAAQPPAAPAPPPAPAGAQGQPARRNGDLNQAMSRLPALTLADLQKGEAVMIVSTQGSAAQPPTAITLLDGVEPLLTGAPKEAQSFLTPWSLAGAPGGGEQ